MPSGGWSDRSSMPSSTWRPAPWIGDEPVTAAERLLDALECRIWAWDLVVIYAGLLGVLGACLAQIAEGVR